MAKYGQTANGMAHFAPMMKLEAPQLDIGNPFKDYIAQAIAERELELKEKGLGLDEQKLAYNAANDEEDRQLARELAGQKAKDAKDYLKMEYDYKNSLVNRAKAEKKLEDDEIEKVRKFAGQIYEDRVKSGENISRMQSFNQLEDFLRGMFGNKYVDAAKGLENLSGNYNIIQSGNKGYNISNRITDLQ
ncbi:hypothetical protein [Campylobacter sp.]|uniref:hypothetical protein n=1 Tax=Campylobacter sp. TaxID=205 RepID=UPI00259C7031|nr:hypothetical protein [Campylobacter sp.]MBQ7136105.1 hypothetical protein [Campylobacter sp.]